MTEYEEDVIGIRRPEFRWGGGFYGAPAVPYGAIYAENNYANPCARITKSCARISAAQ